MQSENLACEWNDVALLTDQRACTFLCKAMLRLPEPANDMAEQIVLKEWSRVSAPDDKMELRGKIQLELLYSDARNEKTVYGAELWLQGAIDEPVQFIGEANLLYSRGQAAGQNLLLEAVIQLPRVIQLQSTQVITGQFEMAETLELPETWPDCSSVLTTAAAAEVQTCTIQNQMLQVEGRYIVTVVYVDDSQPGENLFAWQQHYPFFWQKPVPGGLQELTGVQPYYQSLSVELLDTHRIQLKGSGVICTLPAEGERPVLLQSEYEDCYEDSIEEMQTGKRATMPLRPSVVNSRGSRRAHLARYMRDLNGMAQSPTNIRNYEISETGIEPDKEQSKAE